jgi:hypothetical protein
MANHFYQQYFEAQKAMLDAWQKQMSTGYAQNAGPVESEAARPEAPNDFWKKVSESYQSYQAVFELWKTLSEHKAPLDSQASTDIYNTWLKQGFSMLRSNLLPTLPGQVQHVVEKIFDTMETSNAAMAESMKGWAGSDETLRKAFQDALDNGPKGYIGFMEAWQQGYDATLGKFAATPTFGKDMEFWKSQKASFDRFVKFSMAAAKFYASLLEIAQSATKKVLADYAVMQAEGKAPKTFDEFYKYWARTVTATYEKVLLSSELSELSGDMVNSMSRFKMEYDKLCSFYLAQLPLPKQSDMEDLYKTVYELKKELRALKKEMHPNE